MLQNILEWFVKRRVPKVVGCTGPGPYLSKYMLCELPWRGGKIRVCLRRFHRSGSYLELHDPSWKWMVSWILVGGYREERLVRCGPVSGIRFGGYDYRVRSPGSVNVINRSTIYRVILLNGECWTLCVTGPRVGSGGFWLSSIGEVVPWERWTGNESSNGASGLPDN